MKRKIYFLSLCIIIIPLTILPNRINEKKPRVIFGDCRTSSYYKDNEGSKGNTNVFFTELLKAELMQNTFYELIDEFVIEKTLKQIKVKQQCGMEDCDIQLGKLLFADYIISCTVTGELSKVKYFYNNEKYNFFEKLIGSIIYRKNGFLTEGTASEKGAKINLKLYDVKNGKYFPPRSFLFSNQDFYPEMHDALLTPKSVFTDLSTEIRFPQKKYVKQLTDNAVEPIKNLSNPEFKKEEKPIKKKNDNSGKSRVLMESSDSSYNGTKDLDRISQKVIEDLSKEYDIIDEEAKNKAIKQLEAQQKCGVEDCGINLSKLLNADYTVHLSLDMYLNFYVYTRDGRTVQKFKGGLISEYQGEIDYIFSFRDCIKYKDCATTAR